MLLPISPRGNIQLQKTFFDGERTNDKYKMSDVKCDVESQSNDSCPLVYLMNLARLSRGGRLEAFDLGRGN